MLSSMLSTTSDARSGLCLKTNEAFLMLCIGPFRSLWMLSQTLSMPPTISMRCAALRPRILRSCIILSRELAKWSARISIIWTSSSLKAFSSCFSMLITAMALPSMIIGTSSSEREGGTPSYLLLM